MRLWRISNYADLKGLGGLRADGRWHHRGYPVVYGTESPAAALLEVVVHLEIDDLAGIPDHYQLLEIECAESISQSHLDVTSLPDDWRHRAGVTRSIGDQWLAQRQSALLAVPNAIVPHTVNFLINPLHPDLSQIRMLSRASYPFDDRLFKHALTPPGQEQGRARSMAGPLGLLVGVGIGNEADTIRFLVAGSIPAVGP